MRRMPAVSTIVGLAVLTLLTVARADESEPIVAIPATVAVDKARAELGEQLFNDVRLSRSSTYSCATCHPLDRGGMDGLARTAQPGHDSWLRNTPTVFNAALNPFLNWDGAAATLEDHTSMVVERLMDVEWPALVARLRGVATYRHGFAAAYREGLTQSSVVDAIASFERTLVTPDAPFDRYLRGASDALTPAAREGYRRFKTYGCAACHQGVNAGGNLYQRFGIFEPLRPAAARSDAGRFAITQLDRDRQVFRVPGLRNVGVTAPYFHDGSAATLEQAVDVMGRLQLGRKLTAEDTRSIAEFLRSLTGEYRGQRLTSGGGSAAVAHR